jgi:hypothetical protein
MNYSQDILTECERIFSAYTDSFLGSNNEFDKNILLKIEHSLLVQQEARNLAAAEHFSPRLAAIVEIAALFHDIGRFEQLKKFNTFVDYKSVDHGQLGHNILTKTQMLSLLPAKDLKIIFEVTALHNKRILPEIPDKEILFVAKAVRDADKLDIMRVLLNEYAKGKLDPAVILHLEESNEISPQVMRNLDKGENPNIADFRTLTDFKLAQMAWIYDLNFANSLREFKKRKYHLQIAGYLPDTHQVKEYCDKMFTYLDERILLLSK